jgi:ATP-dependent Clp protease, proteolytic subunit ClpP
MDFELSPIFIPEELENVKLPSPELLSFYENLQERVIWIDDEIGDQLLQYSKYILKWNMEDEKAGIRVEDRKPIKLMIFSPGGSLYSCNHFVDIIELSKTPVWGINVGMAMSAAFLILISCQKRLCTKNSVALIHQGSSGISGNAADVISSAKNYESQLNRLKDRVLEKTTIPSRLYNAKLKEDWYLDASEQLKYGIVETIVGDISELF